MKIIVYGLGKLFEQYKELLDWESVVALVDKKTDRNTLINGMAVISPKMICNVVYDYIAIFSNQFYEEIRTELIGEYFIPKDKIVPWNEIIEEKENAIPQTLELYRSFFAEKKCKRILDVGMSVFPNYCLTKEQIGLAEESELDGVQGERAVRNVCMYNRVFDACEECPVDYDAIILCGMRSAIKVKMHSMSQRARYILFHSKYLLDGFEIKDVLYKELQVYGKVSCVSNVSGILWIIDTQEQKDSDDIAIYVVAHKSFAVLSNDIYRPLCVGSFRKEGWLTEKQGDNIAYLNEKINECTALYWIWKNTNARYVGLNHYRRYFYNNEIKSIDNYLDREHISEYLKEYEILFMKIGPSYGETLYEQIYNSMNHELCEKGYFILRSKIEQYQPDYLHDFDNVMKGYRMFPCNMFVTKREILNRYCEWLFSFLIEAAEEVDVRGYDRYSQRVMGFYAERMWTVWLRRNKLRIKGLPYAVIG